MATLEKTSGREPVQIVEIQQPFCANSYGLLPCTAGMGTRSSGTGFERDFSTDAAGGYGANDGTLTVSGGVANLLGTGADPFIRTSSTEVGFTGDDFRYVVVHGKWNAGTTKQFQMYYSTSIGWANSRSMFAVNLNSSFRGVTLANIEAGQEFVAVFDAADSTDYATAWLGANVNRFRFDFAGSDTDVDIYSIQIGTESLITNTQTACYNTRATCQATAAFALGDPLSLYYTTGKVAETLDVEYLFTSDDDLITTSEGEPIEISGRTTPAYLIPSLLSVSTSPTRINLAASNPDAQGLGNRAVCNLLFQDHPHTDRVVDPYLTDRIHDPITKGSYWTKWLVRNKYRQNVLFKVHNGYLGQSLSDMVKLSFFLQDVSWPDASGRVPMQGKDILAKLEERKAQAPIASPGELYTDIDASTLSIEVAGALTSEYGASGTLVIDDEIMTYSSVASSTNGITFTITARGTDNSTAAAHDAETLVQECLRFSNADIDDAMNTLLATYGGIPAAYLDTAGWATEIDTYISEYKISTVITKPTSVAQLVSDMQAQCLFYAWWDERDALVKMRVIRGISEAPVTFSEESNIISGSFSIKEKPRERVSQVWVYYGVRDWTESLTDANNYKFARIVADLESETDELYGEPSIKKIFAYNLDNGILAYNTASKIAIQYVDNPREVTFLADAKDRLYWVSDVINLSHHIDVDSFGDRNIARWTNISAEEVKPGETIRYTAEDTTLYGKVYRWMPDAAADYPGAATVGFTDAYWGDDDGLLSDGEPCATWS